MSIGRIAAYVNERWTLIGGLPSNFVVAVLLIFFSGWAVLDIYSIQVTTGLAKSSYDAMVRARIFTAAPDSRIVIIDIDEASLADMGKEFGRWPWPRDTLATVLGYIEKQQPAAVVWDIAFSDVDRFNPGGDKAFDQAVARSSHSHFSVVRLPPYNDVQSQLGPKDLASLWLRRTASAEASTVTLAVIPPVLPSVANSRLGYNNGYPDSDGVLRRYRYVDMVSADWAIKSIALSVAGEVSPTAYRQLISLYEKREDSLVAWRAKANSYPRISFSTVFSVADGAKPSSSVPTFHGKIVLIGSTAPSLHDIHPSPLSATQAGVDSLATVIDNAINMRIVRELPQWSHAILAILIFCGVATCVVYRGIASLEPLLFVLPGSLLALSYMSLNGTPVFLDLYLPSALGLAFLAALRLWNSMRRGYWLGWFGEDGQAVDSKPMGLLSVRGNGPWFGIARDKLMDGLAQSMPDCRLIISDANARWPAGLNWPELAVYASLVGPREQLDNGIGRFTSHLGDDVAGVGSIVEMPTGCTRSMAASIALKDWIRIG